MSKAETDKQQRCAVVDEYGALISQIAPWKQKLARVEELAKIIRGWYADADPETGATATGDRYRVVLGPKQLQTRILDPLEVWRAMGRKKFLLAATITLKALEEHLAAAAVASLTTKERTGTRSLVSHILPDTSDLHVD